MGDPAWAVLIIIFPKGMMRPMFQRILVIFENEKICPQAIS
jgi:hypothetical protein